MFRGILICGVSWGRIVDWRDVGTSSGAAAIEDCGYALVIGLVVRLRCVGGIAGIVSIRNRVGIEISAAVVATAMMSATVVVPVGTVGDRGIRSISARAQRSDAGWRAVDGTSAETG